MITNNNAQNDSVPNHPLELAADIKESWDALPPWLQMELQVTATLLNYPETLAATAADLSPHHFFKSESAAAMEILLDHYEKGGQALDFENLVSKLKVYPMLKPSEVEMHLRFLRGAPVICEWHRANTVLRFTTERRIYRALSDLAEAAEEQELEPKQLFGYMLQAMDLPHLPYNECTGWIQSALLKCGNFAHPTGDCPEEWQQCLVLEDGTPDRIALKILSQLVDDYVDARVMGALPSYAKESPEFKDVSAEEATVALKKLRSAGLVTWTLLREVRGPREFLELRPTAKALIPLLRGGTIAADD